MPPRRASEVFEMLSASETGVPSSFSKREVIRKFQTPKPKHQIKTKRQTPQSQGAGAARLPQSREPRLDFGIWRLFDVWVLMFGFYSSFRPAKSLSQERLRRSDDKRQQHDR